MKRLSIVICVVSILIIAAGAIALGISIRHPSQQDPAKIQNKTSILQVISFVPDAAANSAFLTVKNISNDRAVTGIVIDSNRISQQAHLSGADAIYPGKTYSRLLTVQGGAKKILASDISIVAAVLDDGSVDGETIKGQGLIDYRQGLISQAELLLPLVKKTLDSGAPDVISQLVSDINSVPHPHELNLTHFTKTGAHASREILLNDIQEYSNRPNRAFAQDKDFLSHLYQEHSRLLAIQKGGKR